MSQLSSSALLDVTNKLQKGLSSRRIAADVGMSKTFICDLRKKLQIPVINAKPGAPRKLSVREERDLVRLFKKNEVKTAVEAAKKISSSKEMLISPDTIRRALKKNDLVPRKIIKKPAMTVKHRKARLNFALTHKDWTVDDWKRVIWSDETKINRINSDGIQYRWVQKGEQLPSSLVQPTLKFGGGSIMLWGCMTWAGVGKLTKVEGRMNSQQYVEILERSLLPTLDACSILPEFPEREDLIFQQDNDPKHTSKLTKEWFLAKGIKPMPWPAQSPDLNPIEHKWNELKVRLGRYPEQPKGVHELWERTQKEWKEMEQETSQALIESMPRRIEAVIKSKGGPTKY